ncbi:MAG: hypothetical protein SGJ10_09850 [Bacteroidota bacterium]|nr:hypothetical protein [Bacteroidota bacterium]
MKKILYLTLAIITINACKNGNDPKIIGDAKFYIKKNGPKPVYGDNIKMAYKMFYIMPDGTEKKLFRSNDSLDQTILLERDFVGGPNECVLQMSVGDSAEFKVSADSVFKINNMDFPDFMKKGDKIKLVVKLKDVFPHGGGDVKIQLDPTIKAN